MTSSPFWEFSLRFYGREGVAPACLHLQDEGGADVNVLLYLLFLAESRLRAGPHEIREIESGIAPWREDVVRPLRSLRRRLKDPIGAIEPPAREAFRNQVKRIELESERLQQLALEEAGKRMRFETGGTREETARHNLHAYSEILGGFPENPLKIVLQAFTNLPPFPQA